MKEVNINIEGYNVNGICVGCLNYNRRMFYHPTVKECFRLLGNIDVPDGLEVQVCWECLARVHAAINFKEQILKSYDFLISYSKEHTFMDSPTDFDPHATTKIERTEMECYECVPEAEVLEDNEIKVDLKEEEEYFISTAPKTHTFMDSPTDFDPHVTTKIERTEMECYECVPEAEVLEDNEIKVDLKEEEEYFISTAPKTHTFLDSPTDFNLHATTNIQTTEVVCYECVPEVEVLENDETEVDVKEEEEIENKYGFEVALKEETFDDPYYQDLPAVDNDITSDEDVQLSKLKEKESEKGKKKRKSEKKKDKERDRVDSPKRQKTKKEKNPDKKSRKLKNLPEELVELYTMSKEEMWAIRIEDLNSKEFQKLKYRCDDCIIAFNTEKLMHDHLNGKHQPKSEDCHQCSICQAYFLTKDNVAAHKALHQQGYKCRQCGFNTTLKRRMLKHVGSHAPSGDAHVCQTCGGSFSTKSKLTYHRGVCCQEKPQCDCCGKVFANKMTLKYHLKILPQNKDDKPKEKLFIPCKGCDKVFHSKKSYRAHVVIHDGLTYPCPICGKLFQWKRNLARHSRNHRERQAGNLHECRACSKTFASRDCYNNHMRLSKKHVSQDTFPHECNYCGKKFATKWCLTDHIDWDHLKKIKYQCSFCFKAFKTAKILVAHVNNIHEGKKKEAEGEHLCEICGKSYRTVKRLKGHVWAMHTKRSSSKIYKCKLCPATFMWQTSIYKHMKMMHDNNKKSKTPRAVQPVKKEEPYPGIELANRMQYFQQNIGGNLNIVHIQPLGMPQNIV